MRSDFSDELEELRIQSLRIICWAALLELADQMEEEVRQNPDPVSKQELQRFLFRARIARYKFWILDAAAAAYRISGKLATILLILIISGLIAVVNVEAIRLPILNWLVNVQETHTSVHFVPDSTELPDISFGYLPDGYALESIDKVPGYHKYYLTNSLRQPITIFQNSLNTGIDLDTEEAIVSEVTLMNGQPALVVEKDGLAQVLWSIDTCFFLAEGTISADELIKIAESVEFLK